MRDTDETDDAGETDVTPADGAGPRWDAPPAT